MATVVCKSPAGIRQTLGTPRPLQSGPQVASRANERTHHEFSRQSPASARHAQHDARAACHASWRVTPVRHQVGGGQFYGLGELDEPAGDTHDTLGHNPRYICLLFFFNCVILNLRGGSHVRSRPARSWKTARPRRPTHIAFRASGRELCEVWLTVWVEEPP